MGKRSNFERLPRDFYPTPRSAVEPLLPHLSPSTMFVEPCAGAGHLQWWLYLAGHTCVSASDIEPQGSVFSNLLIQKMDAFDLTAEHVKHADCIITNPPWDRKILHPMIEHFKNLKDTWLLFDADWAHTVQSSELIKHCKKIVAVGRVKWIEGSKHTGMDNCSWYCFQKEKLDTTFIGR